jgi:hypoxanthine phosphoribosyltransferase
VIQLHDKTFVPFISAGDIDAMLNRMVWEVEAELKDEVPVFIAVLNGAFMVASDFVRKYSYPCEVSFVKLSSYEGTQSTGEVKQLIGLDLDLEHRSVVIIEDIVDTGNTIAELKKIFENKNVKQLKIAALFFKPEAYTKDIRLDYTGFEIPDKFIVGYGLDYDGLGRNLPEVYQLNTNTL